MIVTVCRGCYSPLFVCQRQKFAWIRVRGVVSTNPFFNNFFFRLDLNVDVCQFELNVRWSAFNFALVESSTEFVSMIEFDASCGGHKFEHCEVNIMILKCLRRNLHPFEIASSNKQQPLSRTVIDFKSIVCRASQNYPLTNSLEWYVIIFGNDLCRTQNLIIGVYLWAALRRALWLQIKCTVWIIDEHIRLKWKRCLPLLFDLNFTFFMRTRIFRPMAWGNTLNVDWNLPSVKKGCREKHTTEIYVPFESAKPVECEKELCSFETGERWSIWNGIYWMELLVVVSRINNRKESVCLECVEGQKEKRKENVNDPKYCQWAQASSGEWWAVRLTTPPPV